MHNKCNSLANFTSELLKISHQKVHNHFPRSLSEILRVNELKFEGKPHSGIDDTRNIANAIKALGLKGHIFDYTI